MAAHVALQCPEAFVEATSKPTRWNSLLTSASPSYPRPVIAARQSLVYLMAGCLGFVHLMLIVLGR